jgi:TonB family protein
MTEFPLMMRVVREVPGFATTAGRAPQRSVASGLGSLGVHAVLLALVFLLAGLHATPRPPAVALTAIEIVGAPPPPPPPPPPVIGQGATAPSTHATASAGTLGRRGHDAPQRSPSRARPAPDPYAELAVSHDRPASADPGSAAGTLGLGVGTGLFGDGTGDSGGGFGNLGVPPPPPPPRSLARPARPKLDYHRWDFRADRRFAGQIVIVLLTIDPSGHVHDVRVLQSVDPAVDRHAADLARRFEFYPALDAAGHPAGGQYRWEFVIVGDNAPIFQVQPRM